MTSWSAARCATIRPMTTIAGDSTWQHATVSFTRPIVVTITRSLKAPAAVITATGTSPPRPPVINASQILPIFRSAM
jgi:hypothetical protein